MNKLLGIMLIGLGLACAANAALIADDVLYVDFGNKVDVSGGNTNNIVNGALTISDAIRLSDGAATGAGVALTATDDRDVFADAGTLAGNALSQDLVACGDALGIANGNGVKMIITFTGLDTSLTYDLTGGLVGATEQAVARYATGWTIENQAETTYQLSDATASAGYITFEGLTTSDGTLTITLDNVGTADRNHVGVSQLTLTAIPEPATLGLVAAFGGGILFIRRRLML